MREAKNMRKNALRLRFDVPLGQTAFLQILNYSDKGLLFYDQKRSRRKILCNMGYNNF